MGDESRKYARYYDENYQRGMKIAYTIGGVDFTQYMDRDAEIPEAGKTELKWLAAKKCSNKDLAKEYGIPAYDGSMSLEQYQKLVQHKLTMDKFIENRPPWRDNAEEYLKDIAFDQMLYDNPGGAQYLSPEEVKTSVGENLERTKNSFNEAYKSIDQKLVAAAVETAAREYAEQGKELPPANDKAYNMAVDGIYTRNVKLKGDVNYEGAVCLRKTLGNEKMLNTKLPQEAEKVQNTSGWERMLYNYMTTVGIPKDEASGKAAAMAEKIRYWAVLQRLSARRLLVLGKNVKICFLPMMKRLRISRLIRSIKRLQNIVNGKTKTAAAFRKCSMWKSLT